MADADIGADDRPVRADLIGSDQPVLEDLAILRRLALRQAGMGDREGVTAEARDMQGAGGAQTAHRLLQQHVAMRMAQRVVDRLEAREVDDEDGDAFGATALRLEMGVDGVDESGARQRAGERVVRREEGQPLLGAAALGDVPEIEAGDAVARGADLAGRDGELEHDAIVGGAAIAQHRERQRRLLGRSRGGEHLLDGELHVDGEDAARDESLEFLALVEELAGDAARGEDGAVRVDDEHAGKAVGDDLLQGGPGIGTATQHTHAGRDRPR